jgi:hypothetical protein
MGSSFACPESAMSNKHRHTLEAIFRDPPAGNLHWREVESLLNHLGAEVESGHGARFRVVLNRREFYLHHPHHGSDFGKQAVKDLREFLASAGVSPSSYEDSAS